MNMHKWLDDVKASPVKKPFPILTFPCVQLMDITVKELISDKFLFFQKNDIISVRYRL